jgi:predicted nucleic acid-binding Zn ribbon protein
MFMPTYEYFCEDNQQTVSVVHGMRERLSTWGEVCARTDTPPGKTSLDTAVVRLITASIVVTKGRSVPGATGESSCCGTTGCGSY